MATKGGEERKGEAVPVPVPVVTVAINPPLSKDSPGQLGFVRSANEAARSVAWFTMVHAAVALAVFLVLKEQDAGHLDQCVEACPVLTILEFYTTLFHNIFHVAMKVCCVVQMLAAALALVSTGRIRWSASFLALCLAVATGTQWIRLVYTALFGSHCCYSGGFVQVTSAVAIVLGQGAIPLWGGFVGYELVHAPLP